MKKLLFALIAILILGCDPDTKSDNNISGYYFPVKDLMDGMVYEYQSVNDKNAPPEYWFHKSVETDSAFYFTGTYYDEQFIVRQFFRAEIVGNGVLLQDQFITAFEDSTGVQSQLHAEIKYGNAFPFEVEDSSEVFLMQLKWIMQEEPLSTTTLTRNRRFAGKTTYNHNGTELPCVEFTLVEEVDNEEVGHLTKEYTGTEYYAKGIGLVYYKKQIDANFVLEYELKGIYTMDKLEDKFNATIGYNEN